jgi:hypothetical protein
LVLRVSADAGTSALRESIDLVPGQSLEPAKQRRDSAFRRVIGEDQALGPSAVHNEGDPIVEVRRPVPLNQHTASELFLAFGLGQGLPQDVHDTPSLNEAPEEAVNGVY